MTARVGVAALIVAALLVAAGGLMLGAYFYFAKPASMQWRDFLSDQRAAITQGFSIDYDTRITTRDGITLKGDLYLPKRQTKDLPTVYIRLPYGKGIYGESRLAARRFVTQNYAVLVQDIRGRHGSGGQFVPYTHAAADGYDSIDWIVKQTWSNGRVGTFGCSALGEIQLISATAPHPALKAMIVRGAGGAIGSARQRYSYFGLYEGGIYNLASGVGWHAQFDAPAGSEKKPLTALPTVSLLGGTADKIRGNYQQLLTLPLNSPQWDAMGYLSEKSAIKVPTLAFNTWYDQTVADSFAIKDLSQAAHPLIIGPGNHCTGDFPGEDDKVGDLVVQNRRAPELNFPYWETYSAWFEQWLRPSKNKAPPALPQYQFFILGEDRWMQSEQWPPYATKKRNYYLIAQQGANSKTGDGELVSLANQSQLRSKTKDQFVYDPRNPVPSRGGPVCCVDDPKVRSGAVDQTDVESRPDVLVYTTQPLTQALRIVGPISLQLVVSSNAPDTDLIARLVDVAADGSTLNIQEGALRLRYRNGLDQPAKPLQAGERYTVTIALRPTAYRLPAGHRLRLQVTSSSFPRLERNLNTGANNSTTTEMKTATNQIWYTDQSRLEFFELP
jgi:uncharacterized protein